MPRQTAGRPRPTLLRWIAELADLMGAPKAEVCRAFAEARWRRGDSPQTAFRFLSGRREPVSGRWHPDVWLPR